MPSCLYLCSCGLVKRHHSRPKYCPNMQVCILAKKSGGVVGTPILPRMNRLVTCVKLEADIPTHSFRHARKEREAERGR